MSFAFVVSADSHLVEPYDLWTKPLGSRWGEAVPHLLQRDSSRVFYTGIEQIVVDNGIISESAEDPEVRELQRRSGWDPDARLRCMEIDGIDAEVLNSTWMLYAMRIPNPDLRRACARVYNDWAAEFVSGHTDRFIASAMIPIDDVSWACDELTRLLNKI